MVAASNACALAIWAALKSRAGSGGPLVSTCQGVLKAATATITRPSSTSAIAAARVPPSPPVMGTSSRCPGTGSAASPCTCRFPSPRAASSGACHSAPPPAALPGVEPAASPGAIVLSERALSGYEVPE
ncbi:hypothetical protein ACFQQB_46805 [Nonomuraea rubra]|uniref:hypothetical protein n=1 Tax=Nonomuraea rubra TaxID=46180 RepID=UPI00337A69A2